MLVLFRRLRSGSEKMNDELISIMDIMILLFFIVIGLIIIDLF